MRPALSSLPRVHVHRGFVEVVALWFDLTLLGEVEARRRVLAGWTPGAGVYVLAGGLLLRLPAPCWMDCSRAPGLTFTCEDGVLLSAPLSAAERERLAPPVGSAVLVRAGVAEVHPLEPSRQVDVAAWLDVSGWDVVGVEGLGAPPPPVVTLAPVAPPPRASFGLGAPAPEAEVMRARMEGQPVSVPVPAARARAPGLFERLRAWWHGRTQRPGSATVESGTAPKKPGLLSRLAEWLATSTPLGPLLNRRKAEYVQRLFELLDGGQLDEALRYAIPLSKGMTEQARVSLGLPGPRERLSIQPRHGGRASVFGGGAAVYDALRERYRAAFEKLKREGRIEEAAFVLAELLHEDEEAVSFLEKHGRLRLAAELAEGRKLAPGLVVRQWMLAREVARAVDFARRTGAFADAVLRLERTHPAKARVLRLLWGEVLAQSGDYARAVEVVWQEEDARQLIRVWLERGVEVGGVSGARLLARMALSFPERFEAIRARVLVLLDAEEAEGAAARLVFAEVLARDVARQTTGMDVGLALLRPAVRAVLRDYAAGYLPLKSRDIENLVQLTGDPVLRADLPPLSQLLERGGFPFDGKPVSHDFDVGEGGPWAIHDAVPLSGGRMLVALGEAGARLVAVDGRCVAHFDVPAFSLVVSVHGDRALALAPRGALRRVSRLDLARRRAEPWCDMRADAFATIYDGNLWFIAEEDTVMAVDALASEPRALWRVPRLGGRVLDVAVGPVEMSFATLSPEGELERWTYSLPDPVLRSRQVLSGGRVEQVLRHLSLRMDGEMVVLDAGGVRWMGAYVGRLAPPPEVLSGRKVSGLVLGGAWMAVLEPLPTGTGVLLVERTQGRLRARFTFMGEYPVSVRFLSGGLLLFDTAGRLARVDMTRGEVRRVVLR